LLLYFQDFIDIGKELTKLSSKSERLQGSLMKIVEAMAKADYTEKVPVEVRDQNSTKVGENLCT